VVDGSVGGVIGRAPILLLVAALYGRKKVLTAGILIATMMKTTARRAMTPRETPTAMATVLLFFFCAGSVSGVVGTDPEKSAVKVGSYQKLLKWAVVLGQMATGKLMRIGKGGTLGMGSSKMLGVSSLMS
jgi:hypothetical protein